jgi:putative two-component system response regulator
MLALVAEYKDSTTGAHIRRIAEYTRLLALELGLDAKEADRLAKASRLHDVGKVGIPDAILRKPGPLTPDEFEQVKRHTRIGGDILAGDPAMRLACEIALHHHERWDGTGYPEGLKSETLPIGSRIIAVVDVFDALVSRRPYKAPWSPESAIAELRAGAGSKFDPGIVDALESLYRRGAFYPILSARPTLTTHDAFLTR